jgi:hypothetical protein
MTIDRIEALRRHIAEAVIQTTDDSLLPPERQDMILRQACRESCDLLSDWLKDPPAEPQGGASRVQVREFLRDQQQFAEFLSPLFADALVQARIVRAAVEADSGQAAKDQPAKDQPAKDQAAKKTAEDVATAREEVDRAVRGALATARRRPRMTVGGVFQAAQDNVSGLRAQVCELAKPPAEAKEADARRAAWRRRARKTLQIVKNVLVTLSLSVVTAAITPQLSHDAVMVGHGAQMIIVHEMAAQAQPGVPVAPPRAGLQPH